MKSGRSPPVMCVHLLHDSGRLKNVFQIACCGLNAMLISLQSTQLHTQDLAKLQGHLLGRTGMLSDLKVFKLMAKVGCCDGAVGTDVRTVSEDLKEDTMRTITQILIPYYLLILSLSVLQAYRVAGRHFESFPGDKDSDKGKHIYEMVSDNEEREKKGRIRGVRHVLPGWNSGWGGGNESEESESRGRGRGGGKAAARTGPPTPGFRVDGIDLLSA